MKYRLTKDIPEVGNAGDIVELSELELNVLPFNSSLEFMKEEKKKDKKNNKGD